MYDSKGLIHGDRDNLNGKKPEFINNTVPIDTSLTDILKGADVFIGLSRGNVLSQEMIKGMGKEPIIFAMANPTPEISYEDAKEARPDCIMATGRSDYPNQVNNVLGFPFIFRGALDVRASEINEAMKLGAVYALADLAKKPVPDIVNIAYNNVNLKFGKDYIIPKPFDPRLISEIPPAIAKAAMDSGVAKEPIEDWDRYKEELRQRSGEDNKVVRLLHNRAKMNLKKIVFAEADHLDVLKAAQIVHEEGIAIPILLGNKEIIIELMQELEFDAEIQIINPQSDEAEKRRNHGFYQTMLC